jgi:hypothetical protein
MKEGLMANANAQLEAQIEKYRPKRPEDVASGGTLWHLNKHGLLPDALAREGNKEDEHGNPVITKQVAWLVMADAQRRGIVFA